MLMGCERNLVGFCSPTCIPVPGFDVHLRAHIIDRWLLSGYRQCDLSNWAALSE